MRVSAERPSSAENEPNKPAERSSTQSLDRLPATTIVTRPVESLILVRPAQRPDGRRGNAAPGLDRDAARVAADVEINALAARNHATVLRGFDMDRAHGGQSGELHRWRCERST